MDFVTSSVLGGIIYDLIKKGFELSRDNLKEKLLHYTKDDDLIQQLVDILNKKEIYKDINKEKLKKILESDKQVTNIINSINTTIQINQQGNITNNFSYNTERKLTDTEIALKVNKLPKSKKKFKLKNDFLVKIICIPTLFIIFLIVEGFNSHIFNSMLSFWGANIFIFVSVCFISTRIIKLLSPNMIIYQDKFLLKNEEILYSNIESFQRNTNNYEIFYILEKDKSSHTLMFSSEKGANYLSEQYHIYQKAIKY